MIKTIRLKLLYAGQRDPGKIDINLFDRDVKIITGQSVTSQ